MSESDYWEALEDWYHRCEEASPDDRQVLLADLRAQDSGMYGELLAMRGAETAAERLEVGVALIKDEVDLDPGELLGPYCIDGELGRGGMGKVYRAFRADGQFERTVAIKVLSIPHLGQELRGRFRREQQTLVRLNDPRIVRLLDGGVTEKGLEYFVMEYVDGVRIDQFCDERHLTVIERLRLFEQTAQAVHAAHRRFVVHRDLKPSNILVDADGTPKVLDFGISKHICDGSNADASLTQSGQRLMTPEYASPEQITGAPITPATDVYSLGVILHRLLCGRSPYPNDSSSLHALEQSICEQDPVRPSTVVADEEGTEVAELRSTDRRRLRQRLRGPLDTIVLKALAKDPEQRYSTAAALAEDVRRVIDGRPILATPPSIAVRLWRFCKGARTKIGAAVLIIAAMAIYGWRTQDLNTVERESAQQIEAQAEEIGLAHSLVEELLRVSTPWSAENPNPQSVDNIIRLLDSGQIRDLETEVKLRVALAHQLLGLDRWQEAERELNRAEAIRNQSSLPLELQVRLDVVRIDGRKKSGRLEDAAQLTNSVVARYDGVLESPTLRASLLRRQSHAESYYGAFEEAADTLHRASLLVDGSDEEELALTILSDQSQLHFAEGDLKSAEAVGQELLDRALSTFGSRHPLVLNARCHLAMFIRARGRFEEALEVLDRTDRDLRRSMGDDHRRLARTEMVRGLVLGDLGRTSEAGQCLNGAVDRLQVLVGEHHPDTISAMNNLAYWQAKEGRVEESLQLYRRTLHASRLVYGPRNLRIGLLVDNLGFTLANHGFGEEAVPYLEESVSIRSELFGDDDSRTLLSRKRLAVLLKNLERFTEARVHLEIVVPAMERMGSDDHERSEYLFLLGRERARDREHDRAIQALSRAANLLDTYTPPRVRMTTLVLVLWANIESHSGNFDAAYEILARAEDTLDIAPDDDISTWREKVEECYESIAKLEDEGHAGTP